ncbi:MAG TPA: ABC transporter ATP-binding protein [Xanthobacteraceae bacterium]
MLLEVVELSKRFGGLTALSNVSLSIAAGEIVGIFGPNGSGKTTLINLIAGILAPSAGRILWKTAEIQGRSPHAIAAAGVVKTFQNPQLFLELPIDDNVAIASHLRLQRRFGLGRLTELLPWGYSSRQAMANAIHRVVALCRLDDVRDRTAASLSYGQEKMLGVAMAMMCEPEVLLLDEPASGLGEDEILTLEEVLRDLRQSGTTLCVIDHKVDFLARIADRAIGLQQGSVIAEGVPAEVLRHPRVVEAYLGRQHARA